MTALEQLVQTGLINAAIAGGMFLLLLCVLKPLRRYPALLHGLWLLVLIIALLVIDPADRRPFLKESAVVAFRLGEHVLRLGRERIEEQAPEPNADSGADQNDGAAGTDQAPPAIGDEATPPRRSPPRSQPADLSTC